ASTIEWGTTTIDVTVSAVPPPGVTDIQGTITFNSSIVHVIDIVGLNGFSGFFFKAIDNVLGTVTFTGAIVGGPGVTAGDILQLTVEAVGAPGESCFVDLVMTVFRHEDGTNIPHTVDHGTFTISITVPPVADFSYTPVDPTVNDIVYFTDLSDDPDGWIVGWNWTFGDGGVSILQNPTHQYVNGGAYTVTLTVIDNDGASDTISQTVTILGPSAAFTYTPTNPTTQDWVQFFDQSTDPTGDIISWSWDFGDSGVSSEQNPDHKFATPGTYRVNLTITNDSDPAVTVSTYRDITVRNAPPVADFTFDPPQPKIGEMVTFGAGGSSDPDGHIVMFEWDFNNDGVTDATGSTVTYSFGIVGARPVTLKVTDDDGASSYTTKVVPVQATAPTAVFTFTPLDPNTGQVVSFDASGSADPDGTIILYEWDFNNDGVTDATGMAVTHSFPTAGVYPVTLVVTDNDGAIDAETKGVPVQMGGTGGANQPPVANFDFEPADPPEVNLNEVVNFRADGCSDPDGTIAAYDWDFNNDGIYDATGMNVSRIFHTGGAKIVTLRVTDNDGAAGFKTRVVAVEFIRPAANFVFEPTEPREGQVVSFDGSSSSDADGRI
ncbi:MAG: PKD domain-containing protein, partial [Dehalococcoidia bacterium]|nr:PKD domain-containing protein [Dehalococcoidia bacterium]